MKMQGGHQAGGKQSKGHLKGQPQILVVPCTDSIRAEQSKSKQQQGTEKPHHNG